MHPTRNKGLGFGGVAAGLAVIAATLLGAANTTASNYWCRPPVIAALAIGGLICTLGLWTLGVTYLGWWQPLTYEERTTQRAEREHQELVASFARRDAVQELLDELDHLRRDLGAELTNGRTFGVAYPATAWEKNRHVLRAYPESRDLVRDAYELTHTVDRRRRERYDAASHDDVNNPEWVKLTEEEARQAQEALDAVETAIAAVTTVRDEP